MKTSVMQVATAIIIGGLVGCVVQQVFGQGNGSTGTAIGAACGLVAVLVYAFTQRNSPY